MSDEPEEIFLDCLPPAAKRQLKTIDAMILGAMRDADERGVQPTLERLASKLHTDIDIVAERVDRLTLWGLLSHTADDPGRVSPDAVIAYCGDVPLV